jgi:hypothetical protein
MERENRFTCTYRMALAKILVVRANADHFTQRISSAAFHEIIIDESNSRSHGNIPINRRHPLILGSWGTTGRLEVARVEGASQSRNVGIQRQKGITELCRYASKEGRGLFGRVRPKGGERTAFVGVAAHLEYDFLFKKTTTKSWM